MNRESPKTLSTRLRHQVYIQSRVRTPDGEGGFYQAWANTTSDPIWASIDPIQARQRMDYKKVDVDATHFIRLSGQLTVNEGDRILFGSRIFEIMTVENIQERGFESFCTCLERR